MSLPIRRPRTIFISDVHLGTRGCKAEFLLDFLQAHAPETLYLVGDIVDAWALKRSWYWEPSHDAVVNEILAMVRRGTRVIYVPGNHDEMLRDHLGSYSGVEVVREAVHETADGRRLLVIHGDEHDAVVRGARWLAHVGDWGYQAAVSANHWLNHARRLTGRPYWSLAGFLKRNVKEALTFVGDFERSVALQARDRGFDGVVCGHIHAAAMREVEGVLYYNDGDWVDSCTALVEHPDGRLELLDWMQERTCLLYAGRTWSVAPSPVPVSPRETISAMR